MGMFGGDEDDSARESRDLLNQQIRDNKAELEAKRQSLYQERLDIIKGQGTEVWHPDRGKGAAKPNAGKPKGVGEMVGRLI